MLLTAESKRGRRLVFILGCVGSDNDNIFSPGLKCQSPVVARRCPLLSPRETFSLKEPGNSQRSNCMRRCRVLLERIEELPDLARKAQYRPAEFAKLCGLTLRSLERQSKQIFAMTPGELLRKLWSSNAQSVLSSGSFVKEANENLCCSGNAVFSRKFKSAEGTSLKTWKLHQSYSQQVSRNANSKLL